MIAIKPCIYPLVDGSEVIDAIGVAGSGSPAQDFQCCQAGLAAMGISAH